MYITMINSCSSTKEINSFQYVPIPSPRDIFRKYGERLGSQGTFSCSAESPGTPQMVAGGSVIDQMINAQNLMNSEQL